MNSPKIFDTNAVKVVLQYDSADAEGGRKQLIFEHDHRAFDEYLEAVDEIVKSMGSTEISLDEKSKLGSTIHIAKNKLKYEFQSILNSSLLASYSETSPAAYSTSFSTGGYSFAESIMGSVHDLRSIAERMRSMGYPQDCKILYRAASKSHLDAHFKRIGIEKLSMVDIRRMQWEELEEKIGAWIRAAQFCLENLFWREKIMCQEVFEDLSTSSQRDSPFCRKAVQDSGLA